MATSQSIRVNLDALSESVLEAESFIQACGQLLHGEPDDPVWVYAVHRQIDRIRERSEALEVVLRQQAIPRLEAIDADKVRESNVPTINAHKVR